MGLVLTNKPILIYTVMGGIVIVFSLPNSNSYIVITPPTQKNRHITVSHSKPVTKFQIMYIKYYIHGLFLPILVKFWSFLSSPYKMFSIFIIWNAISITNICCLKFIYFISFINMRKYTTCPILINLISQ